MLTLIALEFMVLLLTGNDGDRLLFWTVFLNLNSRKRTSWTETDSALACTLAAATAFFSSDHWSRGICPSSSGQYVGRETGCDYQKSLASYKQGKCRFSRLLCFPECALLPLLFSCTTLLFWKFGKAGTLEEQWMKLKKSQEEHWYHGGRRQRRCGMVSNPSGIHRLRKAMRRASYGIHFRNQWKRWWRR